MWIGALLLAAVELVADGESRLRIESDGSEGARRAVALLKRNVVLMSGAALPETGSGPALRFVQSAAPGYTIRLSGADVVVEGDDLLRAAYDLLEGWGCRFDVEEPVTPRKGTLEIAMLRWRRQRELYVESAGFDPSLPASGVAVLGIEAYAAPEFASARALGYAVRVASTSFDDFLPPERYEEHRDWFALRRGAREPRGNFALTNPAARTAYLESAERWLEAHPEVECLGIWPEVTTIWCEESEALGHAEAYALLWKEAAARFPGRKLEILATGLTLRPPKTTVPKNVEVRLRPGRDASGLQALADQEIDAVVRAWEARGARVVLEIDAGPDSWCGMSWPCHEAIRGNAKRFPAAVLRNGTHLHARLWRDPDREERLGPGISALLERARKVTSWGHPRDAADLFFDEGDGIAFRIAANERLLRLALKESTDLEARRSAAADAFLGYHALRRALPEKWAKVYRRYRGRDYRQVVETLLPEGVEHRVGPALVREGLARIDVETDRLRLSIDRATATVTQVRLFRGNRWSGELCGDDGRFFAVVALATRTKRVQGDVALSSPGQGRLRIDLSGRLAPGGPRWRSRLDLRSASGAVHQTAEVFTDGGIAAGCRWKGARFDRWVCPAFTSEGRLQGEAERILPAYRMPTGTLLYCREGERGTGLAVRTVHGGASVSVRDGPFGMLVATSRGRTIQVDWILFSGLGELGH
ncbi:MAG: DUF4838 domain-containing protein [Planctomycetota bacterium]|jgi:hypothetical protein